MMEERNSDIYKNLVNEKINSETCCLNPSGGWISKQDSFILEVDVLYQDETTNKEYAEILKVFYDSHNEEFKQYLPSDIQAIYDEHRRK